jgi:hypothetical protein
MCSSAINGVLHFGHFSGHSALMPADGSDGISGIAKHVSAITNFERTVSLSMSHACYMLLT